VWEIIEPEQIEPRVTGKEAVREAA
jgi:hypothetical protein